MSLLARSNISTAKTFLPRTMLSLAPGHVLQGTRWDYRILEGVKGDDRTHASTIFKAYTRTQKNSAIVLRLTWPSRAIVKAASPNDEIAKENLDRGCRTYGLPGVSSAACFRQLYDVIDNSTIALEWLDTTLAQAKYQPGAKTYVLIDEVLSGRVIAIVGDLGLAFASGDRINVQPFAMRAPEVFLGQACTELAQVWVVGAIPRPLINESWSMAKVKRLFPDWNIPAPGEVKGYSLQDAVESARFFSEEIEELQAILPFETETQKVEMLEQLRDLLRLMLLRSINARRKQERPKGGTCSQRQANGS
ncbi:hypothetical protein B0T26DRAFT_680324 [Lasiosphaeria miniovina]|uniref:Uncharacterized protein n=1 Tax=Lasiosphaeria miniovina TaxID=1954250 RepID=A0AA40DMH0_9PEZI|nr:uncharacterized protein B0T26DRAFT_680324 [Lasiosphaeria miniovina]KAK0706671.1 hypothetical protein B0T26DRAFT_680324 [Lasiosphaeria miniovina]